MPPRTMRLGPTSRVVVAEVKAVEVEVEAEEEEILVEIPLTP